MSRFEQPTFLIHSAKGSTWEKKDHKYVKRYKGKNGKWVYIYADGNGDISEGTLENLTDEDRADLAKERKNSLDNKLRLSRINQAVKKNAQDAKYKTPEQKAIEESQYWHNQNVQNGSVGDMQRAIATAKAQNEIKKSPAVTGVSLSSGSSNNYSSRAKKAETYSKKLKSINSELDFYNDLLNDLNKHGDKISDSSKEAISNSAYRNIEKLKEQKKATENALKLNR